MNKLTSIEEEIMKTIRANKPMTIAELKEKLYGFAPPASEFYHDLNFLIIYRRILKTVIRGKRSLLFECTPSTFNKRVLIHGGC